MSMAQRFTLWALDDEVPGSIVLVDQFGEQTFLNWYRPGYSELCLEFGRSGTCSAANSLV